MKQQEPEIETTLQQKEYKCCGRELPLSAFRVTKMGRLNTCNECVKKRQLQGRLDKKTASLRSEDVENAKQARLADFTPRELMGELKRRVYEGKLTYVETHVIDLNNL